MSSDRKAAVARYVEEQIEAGATKSHAVTMAAADFGISKQRVYDYVHRTRQRVRMAAIKPAFPHRQYVGIENGVALVFSDAHYWPGPASTAHRGLVKLAREFGREVKVLVANGDMVDGSQISRHPPIGWERRPSLIDEIEATQERLGEIADAAPKAKRVWDLGNHDARFETRLATVAPEYARIHGVHLRDHFPDWTPAWSTWLNDGPGGVVVKHRFKGGVHATHNNTLWAGKSIVTGHLHSGKVTPFTDYNGTRYGVDTGTLADPEGEQFVDYTEDGPKNWTSSFGVLTFWRGRLLPPELAVVIAPGLLTFRGKVLKV